MKRHLRIPLLLLISLLTDLVSYASNEMSFHQLGVKTGMSDNYIQAIERDRYGFMWFATRDGLNRYDGYHFKTYTTLRQGAYNNSVEWVAEDAAGNVWIKTPVNYCFYDREMDELDNRTELLLHKMGIFESPRQLFIDDDKNLWCVADNTLYYYIFADEKLHKQSLPGKVNIADMACRNRKCYILMADGNVINIDWMNKSITKLFHLEIHTTYTPQIYLDFSSRLWIYATHSAEVRCYSLTENNWTDFAAQTELSRERTMITTITDDGKGNIWIGTDGRGIFICPYNKEKGKVTRLFKDVDKLYSLPDNHVTYIYKDSRDVIWIGTGKKGVAYSGLNNLIFENHYCPQLEDVSCFYEDGNDNLWMGFDGEGIASYDKERNTYIYYKSKNKAIPSDLIVCSFPDNQGRVWWGSFGGGAFYYQNGRFAPLNVAESHSIELPQYIRRITQDNAGNLWFATYNQGLYCLEPSGALKAYTMSNSTLLTNYIADLTYVEGHSLYVATSSGVYHMNTSTREMTILERTADGEEVIQDKFANCIYQDSRGLLWIGGRKGVNIYSPKLNKLINLNTSNGVSHSYIRAIIEDASHNMWLTTDHGITRVEVMASGNSGMPDFRCHPYYEEDGIGNLTFNNFSIFCNRKNEVIAGGGGGYVKMIPNSNELFYFDRQVIFTDLYIDNECVNANKPAHNGRIILTKNIQLLNDLNLNYYDNSFAVEVSAMDYGNLHKLQYEYRLNKNEEWIKLEGNRIYFNKLAPGTYQLQVRVVKVHDYENDAIAALTIKVHPPFWLSNIAYAFYMLLLASAVSFIFIQMKRKHRRLLLQQKHDMETAQQHEIDEAKLRFFTNVSHDLRTPLSLIITPLEQILAGDTEQGIKKELRLIHRNALALLDVINQLLDLRRLDNGKARLNPSHGDLADFIKEVCTSFHSYGEKKGITFNLSLKTETLETDFDKNKMQRIMLNLLSNAFKYNVIHGSVNVVLNRIVKDGREYACIQVADTGIGIREENRAKIFDRFYQEEHSSTDYIGSGIGMHIVKEYVTLHHGDIRILDNYPQGTVFEFIFPIRHECKNSGATVLSADQLEIREEPSQGEAASGYSLLIVEDNEDFRQFIVDCLKDRFTIYEAEQGEKAMEMLAMHDISLVISDVRMPVMNGLELCNKIKGDILYSHIPVILLTARTAQEHMLEGLREGADDYITKPFNLDILMLRIRKLLEWSSNNHQRFGKVDISPAEITISNIDERLIERAIQVVEENMDNAEFSVENLSMSIGMSRGHLYKKLMMITGKSPLEFIRILRIKRGKQLLEQSQESISQIAYQVGLSPKQFAKYFKEEFGCLPSEFNKKDRV